GNLQVTSITGGLPPFQYSIDGSTWQNTTLFSGLSFGNYTVVVQDDLGCEYSFDQTLNGSAITIDMNFLASTYNEQGDTILVSNTTVFNGLDSLKWEYPLSADVQIENDSILQLSMDTEGWYDITLLGYLDSVCEYSLTKAVYFGGLAPSFDSLYVEYSIVSDSIYPNPTNGTFTISVEFGKAQNYSIIVTNAMGQPIPTMNVSGQGKFINQIMSFPSGTASQTYYINLIADYDAKRIAIMLN
ncbi:MAG: T9SS type A sorting domain-containing protein, partial [Crocinitomicaceae bacterium]|nr:T9SS type A sorting domain-containing protein [Crocinitomicaceae bacterium]